MSDKALNIILNLRRVMRHIDLRSNYLSNTYGLTGPQSVICKTLLEHKKLTVTQLSNEVYLSKGTVVSIIDRLVAKELVTRTKGGTDKRHVFITPTKKLELIYQKNPPELVDETFLNNFNQLKEWEQSLILASVERLVDLMQPPVPVIIDG